MLEPRRDYSWIQNKEIIREIFVEEVQTVKDDFPDQLQEGRKDPDQGANIQELASSPSPEILNVKKLRFLNTVMRHNIPEYSRSNQSGQFPCHFYCKKHSHFITTVDH